MGRMNLKWLRNGDIEEIGGTPSVSFTGNVCKEFENKIIGRHINIFLQG